MWFGFLLGSALSGPRGDGWFLRMVFLMSAWVVLPLVITQFARANLGGAAATGAAFAGPLALLAYTLHRPFSGRLKRGLLEGLLLWCWWTVVVSAAVLTMKAYRVGMDMSRMQGAGKWLGYAAAALAVQAALKWWLARCRERLGEEVQSG